MSLFPSFGFIGTPFGGDGYGWPAVSAPIAPAPAPDAKAEQQEPIERPYAYSGGHGSFPGFDTAPPASPFLFWQMRRFYVIALAHAVVTAPILAGTQSVEVRDDLGDPEEADRRKGLAEKHIMPLVADVLPPACEFLHFGHWLQETVWDEVDGVTVPVGFNSFRPGEAVIFRDVFGRFAGYQVNGQYRDSRYGFLAVNEPWVDPIFGYSRNENCREEWWRARQSELNADKIERKAAGIQMMLGVPQGSTFTDDTGKPVFPADIAKTITNAAVQGQTFVVPLTPFQKKDIVADPTLANIPAVRVDKFDWGEIGPKLLAHLQRLDHLERSIMRGWRRPEREAMEGHHGTKAEAGAHGAIGTTDSELVHAALLRQFSRQVLNRWLVTNFGPEAADTLYVKASPLADPQQEFLQKVAEVLAQNQQTGPDFVRQINLRDLTHRTEIPILSEDEVAAKKLEEDKAAAAAPPPAPANGNGNGAPPVNGNGKPRLAASAHHVEDAATVALLASLRGSRFSDDGDAAGD